LIIIKNCLYCRKTEWEILLVTLHYQRAEIFICSDCFPTLLHEPAKLASKLQDSREIESTEHDR
jgi:hypothetical protein